MKKIQLILSAFIAAVMITSCSKDEPIVLSSLKGIDSFEIAFDGVDAKDVQTEKKGENITISVPFKTSLTGLKPTIKVSEKATVLPASGTAIDFTDGVAKQFTVTAEDKTTKAYNVTINVRGEVGSGSRIKTYQIKDNTGQNILTTYVYDKTSNFVKSYTVKEGTKTMAYTLVYDSKNQVTEKKADKESTVYTYNDKGQIISAKQTKEGKLAYTYTYNYAADGKLSGYKRVNEGNKKEDIHSYKYDKGNVIEATTGKQTLKATYDDKNNPFYNIYPKAYTVTNLGVKTSNTNKNNPIKGSFSTNTDVKYTYNKDNYPETAAYTVFGYYNIKVAYSYY